MGCPPRRRLSERRSCKSGLSSLSCARNLCSRDISARQRRAPVPITIAHPYKILKELAFDWSCRTASKACDWLRSPHKKISSGVGVPAAASFCFVVLVLNAPYSPVCPSVRLSIRPSVSTACPSVCLSVRPSVHPSRGRQRQGKQTKKRSSYRSSRGRSSSSSSSFFHAPAGPCASLCDPARQASPGPHVYVVVQETYRSKETGVLVQAGSLTWEILLYLVLMVHYINTRFAKFPRISLALDIVARLFHYVVLCSSVSGTTAVLTLCVRRLRVLYRCARTEIL